MAREGKLVAPRAPALRPRYAVPPPRGPDQGDTLIHESGPIGNVVLAARDSPQVRRQGKHGDELERLPARRPEDEHLLGKNLRRPARMRTERIMEEASQRTGSRGFVEPGEENAIEHARARGGGPADALASAPAAMDR